MHTQTGILDMSGGNSGAKLRVLDKTLISSPKDPIVPNDLIRQYQLRPGLEVEVNLIVPGQGKNRRKKAARQNRGNKKPPPKHPNGNPNEPMRANKVLAIEGEDPQEHLTRIDTRKFEDLTSVDPQPRLTLEYPGCPPACRLIDLFCPIGYGTRGMIVSPPKAGKTTLLQNIAFSLSQNHPDVKTIALLVDERPEEVTDFRRNVPCEVLASSNDHTPEKHVKLGILAIERAKRMVEQGQDVVILLDSLTRLGRAFNTAPGQSNSGRTLSGGVDAGALSIPKQLFGAARKFEEGGSLTIVATCLVDTGSRGDQVIFEEFKGTGNMELILDRKVSEKRLFPAIDLAASGTRKEHLLMSETELSTMTALRRRLLNMPPPMQVEQLLKALQRFETNAALVGLDATPAAAPV